jgi:hypothetical protein
LDETHSPLDELCAPWRRCIAESTGRRPVTGAIRRNDGLDDRIYALERMNVVTDSLSQRLPFRKIRDFDSWLHGLSGGSDWADAFVAG